jgi:hypothetical protein
MSRVLSLSLTDNLYDQVLEHAEAQGLTVYQYVRKAVEASVIEDDHIIEMLTELSKSAD